MVLELAGGLEVAAAAMRALLGTDVMFDEGGAGRGLGPKGAGVVTVSLAATIGARAMGRVAAPGRTFAAPVDGLQLVFDLGQPAAEVGVLRLQVGDPSLQRGDVGQDSGLGLGRDRVLERRGDRRLSDHTFYYEAFVQKVRSRDASGTPKGLLPRQRRRSQTSPTRQRG